MVKVEYSCKPKSIKKNVNFNDNFFLFGGKNPLSSSTIDRRKHDACIKAKIKEITQHEFRHSYATRLLSKGIPIDFISRSMGHSRVSMTVDTYCHNEKRIHCIPFLKWLL